MTARGSSVVDLRNETPAREQGAALSALRDLQRGGMLKLLLAREPSLLMQSLNLQLRGNLAWNVRQSGAAWTVEVRHRADTPVTDVVDALAREHQRLDALMAELLRRLNTGDALGAAPVFAEFADLLKTHIAFEDRELAPLTAAHEREASDAPTAIMLREHRDILAQLDLIAEVFAATPPDAGEAGAFCAILSGTLAKHEHREETMLFAAWRRELARSKNPLAAER